MAGREDHPPPPTTTPTPTLLVIGAMGNPSRLAGRAACVCVCGGGSAACFAYIPDHRPGIPPGRECAPSCASWHAVSPRLRSDLLEAVVGRPRDGLRAALVLVALLRTTLRTRGLAERACTSAGCQPIL